MVLLAFGCGRIPAPARHEGVAAMMLHLAGLRPEALATPAL